MKRISAALFLPIALDQDSATPMCRQLYDWFRVAVAGGQLLPGQRVPSTRALAAELGISRIPVLNAYQRLLAEGYLEGFSGAGTCVARSIPDRRPTTGRLARGRPPAPGGSAARRISARSAALTAALPRPDPRRSEAFRVDRPAVDHFPVKTWSRLISRRARETTPRILACEDPLGYPPFRDAVAEYVRTVRGVRCDAAQVVVTAGSQQALQLAAQVLLDPGDSLWIEEPGYPGARRAFTAAGAHLIAAPVDDEGLNVSVIMADGRAARAVYVTPSHQFPLGGILTPARRARLLEWAAETGTWIIEDDYASEYQLGCRPLTALQGLDASERVIYVGTFSTAVFPALRLGYLVVPSDLVAVFARSREAAGVRVSALDQATMTDFIREGHLARHIRRMRKLYRERRTRLIAELATELGAVLRVVGSQAGTHLTALLPDGYDDMAITAKASELGLAIMPLSSCYLNRPTQSGLILGYASADIAQIDDAIRTLGMSLPSRRRSTSPERVHSRNR